MKNYGLVVLVGSILLIPAPAIADPDVKGRGSGVYLSDEDASLGAEKNSRFGGGRSQPVRKAPVVSGSCAFPDRISTSWDCGYWVPPSEEAEAPEGEELTAAQIRRAVREIPMPALQVRVQPGERTLVNVPTIFYTEPRTLRESVTLLGHRIEVEATASSFRWHHGDGSTQATSDPGAPYPRESVTHAYRRVADEVAPRVDATYTVRYRVDGGAWTPLGENLTAAGPAASLEVDEAAPVLVRP